MGNFLEGVRTFSRFLESQAHSLDDSSYTEKCGLLDDKTGEFSLVCCAQVLTPVIIDRKGLECDESPIMEIQPSGIPLPALKALLACSLSRMKKHLVKIKVIVLRACTASVRHCASCKQGREDTNACLN